MTSTRPILVTFDGSTTARAVFEPAASLAREMNTSLVLLQVHSLPTHIWTIADAGEREMKRQAFIEECRSGLVAVAKELEDSTGVQVQPILRSLDQTWSVVDTILAVADEIDPPLICMATHGEGSQVHLIIGSTSIGVLSRSKRPLVLIRSDS